MLFQSQFVRSLLLLLIGVLHIPLLASGYAIRQVPTPPSADPFYTPPEGYESTSPGTILASRTTPNPIAAFGLVPVPLAGAYQLLYRSTDSFGNATSAVTTVLVPLDADPTKLLSYQIAQDSSYINCAPSYALQLFSEPGGLLGTIETQIEILAIAAALKQGWIVAVPDHEGPSSAFLANTRGAHAVLDGIRAALSPPSTSLTGLSTNPTVTLWGYSGGSLVSATAAEQQPVYAPDLSGPISGVALGGLVPNITSAAALINASLFAGLLPGGILGLAHEYPGAAAKLSTYLRPDRAATFLRADAQCLGANIIQVLEQDVLRTYFTDPDVIFTDPELVAVQEANALGKERIRGVPVYMYKAVWDEVSAVADTDALYDFYCSAGAVGGAGSGSGGVSVDYRRDLTTEHAGLLVLGIPAAVQWLKDRMDGVVAQAGCRSVNVISTLGDAVARDLLGDEIVDALNVLLGELVGLGIAV